MGFEFGGDEIAIEAEDSEGTEATDMPVMVRVLD
jgi:hypothetical protein